MLSDVMFDLGKELEESIMWYTKEPFLKIYDRDTIEKIWKIRIMMEELRIHLDIPPEKKEK